MINMSNLYWDDALAAVICSGCKSVLSYDQIYYDRDPNDWLTCRCSEAEKVVCKVCLGQGGAIGDGIEQPCHSGPYQPTESKPTEAPQSIEHHVQAALLREKGWAFVEYDEYGQEVWGPLQS